MKTTTEEVKAMLLSGRHITKLDLFYESEINSSCLPQRIYDIKHETDWNIQSKSVKGKGTLREYWLEPEEIKRIKGQLTEDNKNIAEKPQNEPVCEVREPINEQMGLGLPWQF